jgi:hypothetical protein
VSTAALLLPGMLLIVALSSQGMVSKPPVISACVSCFLQEGLYPGRHRGGAPEAPSLGTDLLKTWGLFLDTHCCISGCFLFIGL